eukprot:SAG31_NODE_34146_length_336_cov_0.641350_2_plen_53_part_01
MEHTVLNLVHFKTCTAVLYLIDDSIFFKKYPIDLKVIFFLKKQLIYLKVSRIV